MSNYNMRLLSKRFGRSSQPNYHPTSEQQEHLSSVQNKIRNDFYELQKYPCPTCDCHDPEIIGEVDRHGLPCSTTICTGCGLLMTNPCFRPEDYGDFYAHHYRGIYEDIRIGVSGEEIPEDYEAIIQNKQRVVEQYKFLQKHCEINSTLKVLELGCGKGELLYQLDKDGCECIGTDYDEKAIAFGQAHGLKLVKGDLSNVNENDFDLVIMSHSLEHIPNPAEIINDISSKLSDSGKLFINVPNIMDTFTGSYSDLMHIIQFVHLFNFTPLSLNNLMAKCHFSNVATESNSDGQEILAIFEVKNTEGAEILTEYANLSRILRRHERSRWLHPHYLYEKFLHYSYPYRHSLGLSNLQRLFKR